jgi:outer membrane protein
VKKVLLLLLISAAVAVGQTQPFQLKVGYVDSETILAQYPAAIKAKSDLEALVSKWRQQVDSMTADLQQAYTEFQKQAQTMTPDKQKEAQQKLVEKDQKIQQFREQKFSQPNGEYFLRQEQLMAPVKEKVFEAIEQIAKEEGMHYVLDKAGDVVVLYADPQFDITFKVLDLLKRGKK